MSVISPSDYQNIVDKFFLQISKDFESTSVESEFFQSKNILELTSIFGETLLESALHILDTRAITVYQLPNFLKTSCPAEICEIQGKQKNITYFLFPNINFCPCPAFEFQVLAENRNNYTCKHVLALKLSKHLGKFKLKILNKNQFNCMLQQMNE